MVFMDVEDLYLQNIDKLCLIILQDICEGDREPCSSPLLTIHAEELNLLFVVSSGGPQGNTTLCLLTMYVRDHQGM